MSKKRNKKRDDYNLEKIILITALIGLIEKILGIIILIYKSWGK